MDLQQASRGHSHEGAKMLLVVLVPKDAHSASPHANEGIRTVHAWCA
jgi:hypothetical protein